MLYERATVKTAEQMDFSPSVSPQELEKLIAKSTSKAVSNLSREIQSLKSKLEHSNSTEKKSTARSPNRPAKNSQQRGPYERIVKKETFKFNYISIPISYFKCKKNVDHILPNLPEKVTKTETKILPKTEETIKTKTTNQDHPRNIKTHVPTQDKNSFHQKEHPTYLRICCQSK